MPKNPEIKKVLVIGSGPTLSTVALYWCLRNNPYVAQRMQEPVAPTTSMAEALARTKRAVVSTISFSLICGFVIELDIFNNLQYAQTDLTGLFGIIAALGMLAVLLAACIATFALSRYKAQKEQIQTSGETILSISADEVESLSWDYDGHATQGR